MGLLKAVVDRRAVEAVERVLREHLAPYGFEGSTVVGGVDHDGEPVLFVDVRYRWGAPPPPRNVTFGLVGRLREALLGIGEGRFPHVRHRLPDGRVVPG